MSNPAASLFVRSAAASLSLAFLVSCGRSASSYANKASTLFARGEYAEAALNYRKALQKNPSDGDLYYHAALAELKENKAPQAFQDLNQAVRLAPQHQAARSELETLVLTSYLSDPAHPKVLHDILVKLSEQWLHENAESPEGLRIKGYLAMVDRRPEEAVDLLQRAHAANPREAKIALGLMDALVQSGKQATAEQVGLDFVAANKSAGEVYDALYRLYLTNRRPEDGKNILERKVKENPNEASYVLQLASHYAHTGKKPEMEATLQTYLANPNAGRQSHLSAGDFYAALGDWTRALEQYQSGLAANPKDQQLYQRRIARALIADNKREEALKTLNAAIAGNSDDNELRALRAALLIANDGGKPGKGIEEFQALVDKHPDDLSLRLVFAKAQLECRNLAGARTQLLEIVKKNPNFLEAQLLLSDIAMKQGNMQEAARYSEAALQVDPENQRAQIVRGTALVRLGNLGAASTVLSRLARQMPDSLDVRLQLADLDIRRRNFAQAEAAFSKMRESNPNELRALAGLVNLDMAQNRPEHALARLEQELRRSPDQPQVRYLMALTALRGGRYSEAIENLQRLAAQTQNSIDPLLQLAQVYRQKGDIRNAIAALQKAVLLQPKDPRASNMLPSLLEMDNRRQEAVAQARLAFRQHPDDPGAMNNLAYMLAETGDNLDDALKLARTAAGKVPGDANFADTLAFIYMKREQNDEALQIFDKLVRAYPNEPLFAYHLGVTWFQKGDNANAKFMLRRALQLKPSPDTQTQIGDLLGRLN